MMAKEALLSSICGFLFGCIAAAVSVAPLAAAPNNVLPVPAVTIYPGDRIQESFLVDREFSDETSALRGAVINSRLALVGKLARWTLLPGVPIPMNAVSEPNAISNGARVRVVFEQDGLDIETYAIALQAGSVGQVISVRNPDSGTTISGIVQADGSVRVGG
ncbi:MAG: flagellar basal body P-ring formation chaperone FlgA [Methylovirgula sp.]